jgi:hypothetical protein
MNRNYMAITIGVALILTSLALDLAGSRLQSLPVLIVSFALGVAGAVISVRGIIEFVSERF